MRSLLLALSLVLLSGAAAAQTPASGPEFQVNVSSTGNQSEPRVAVAFGGAFAVVWQSDAPPNGENVLAHGFDAFGLPLSGEFLVNSFVTDRQRHPDVASYGSGFFVVVWDSNGQETSPDSHTGVYGRRFDAAGNFKGSEFHVNTTEYGYQFAPAVATIEGSGDFVVAWSGSQAGPYDQRFDYPSAPQGSESPPLSGPLASSVDVAEAVFGYFVVVWQEGGDRDGSGTGIFAQAFDDAGLPLAPAFQVNTYTTGDQLSPRVVAAGTGFTVIWRSEGQDGEGHGVFGRRFNFLPAPEGGEFLVTTDTAGDQSTPAIAANSQGQFIVVWSQPSGIFGQRFDERGRRFGGQFQVDESSTVQGLPAVGMDDFTSGGFVVAWQRSAGERAGGDGDGYAVIARHFQFDAARPMRVDEPAAASLRAPRSSNGNGVLEPGETVAPVPAWKNVFPGTQAFAGSASSLGGPAGGTYALDDSSADYGSIDQGETADCRSATGNCYQVTVSGSPRPATHWDASLRENLSVGLAKDWALHVGGSFTDVPLTNPFYKKIETLLHEGITAGCTATAYCPGEPVSRGQMSLFVARAMTGHPVAIPEQGSVGANTYNCAAGGTSLFTDVLPTDIFCKSVHYIASRSVTRGCGAATYCPGDTVTRLQMAAFVAKAIPPPPFAIVVPPVYGPDPVTGLSYSCVPESPNVFFTDVPATDPFCRHVHFLWAKGIIAGCGGTQYCPNDAVTREAMAKFLSNAFNLHLYGP